MNLYLRHDRKYANMKDPQRKETPARKAARILIGVPVEELEEKGFDFDPWIKGFIAVVATVVIAVVFYIVVNK